MIKTRGNGVLPGALQLCVETLAPPPHRITIQPYLASGYFGQAGKLILVVIRNVEGLQ